MNVRIVTDLRCDCRRCSGLK